MCLCRTYLPTKPARAQNCLDLTRHTHAVSVTWLMRKSKFALVLGMLNIVIWHAQISTTGILVEKLFCWLSTSWIEGPAKIRTRTETGLVCSVRSKLDEQILVLVMKVRSMWSDVLCLRSWRTVVGYISRSLFFLQSLVWDRIIVVDIDKVFKNTSNYPLHCRLIPTEKGKRYEQTCFMKHYTKVQTVLQISHCWTCVTLHRKHQNTARVAFSLYPKRSFPLRTILSGAIIHPSYKNQYIHDYDQVLASPHWFCLTKLIHDGFSVASRCNVRDLITLQAPFLEACLVTA